MSKEERDHKGVQIKIQIFEFTGFLADGPLFHIQDARALSEEISESHVHFSLSGKPFQNKIDEGEREREGSNIE